MRIFSHGSLQVDPFWGLGLSMVLGAFRGAHGAEVERRLDRGVRRLMLRSDLCLAVKKLGVLGLRGLFGP